jgi:branched-chain amino acid transport system ATP-binding protein
MPEGRPVLSITVLEVRYGAALAVRDVTLRVESGSVLTLRGANGAGKSSIARACAGLVRPAAGTTQIGDKETTRWSADRVRREGLVYLPEGRGVFGSLTVMENLRLAVRLTADPRAALDRVLEFFPILAERPAQLAGSLSGGEQQMLSLARAVAEPSKIVIVDEPSLGLAPLIVEQVFDALREANRQGQTMIIIEQFAHLALELSHSCAIVRRGSISWTGLPTQASEMLSSHYLGP